MSRPRGADAGVVLHVGCRGVNRMAVFGDDREYRTFTALLKRVAGAYGWSALAYCLMGNHHHLLVRPARANLSEGMRELHREYATWLNGARGREGRVWDGPYWSRAVGTERHLFACLRYIARNPVEAGLRETPEAWPWSSHRAVAEGCDDGITDVGAVLPFLAEDEGRARRAYRELVAADPRATRSSSRPRASCRTGRRGSSAPTASASASRTSRASSAATRGRCGAT